MYQIDRKYGIPVEEISCPGCGLKYGHHKTKVCSHCNECSKCCWCKDRNETPNLMNADIFIQEILEIEPYPGGWKP